MYQNDEAYLFDAKGNQVIGLSMEVSLVSQMQFYEMAYYEKFKQYMNLEVISYIQDDTKIFLGNILKNTGTWPDFDDSQMQVNIQRSRPWSSKEFYTVLYRYLHEAGICYTPGEIHPLDDQLQNTPFISLGKYGRVIIKPEPKMKPNFLKGTLFDNPQIVDLFPVIDSYPYIPMQNYLMLLPETIELTRDKSSVMASPTDRFTDWFVRLPQEKNMEIQGNFYFRKQNENTVIMGKENICRMKIEKINKDFKLSEDYPREYEKKYGSSVCFTKMMCILEDYFMRLDIKPQLNHNLQDEKSSLALAPGMSLSGL